MTYQGRYRPAGPPGGADFGALLRQVPGVSELQEQGFVALETLLGQTEFGRAWPAEHRRVLHDTRFAQTGTAPFSDDDLTLYLVRSPWPSVELDVVITLLWRWLRRNTEQWATPVGEHGAHVDQARQLAVVEQFFRQPETWVRAYRRGRVNPTR